jgi:hypothetical protein
VLLIFGLAFLGLVGCGSNPNDEKIRKVLELLGDASSLYKELKNNVKTATDKSKADGKPIPVSDWKKWTIRAEHLKEIAQYVQAYKGHFDTMRETTTEEQKKQFVASYGSQFREGANDLDREEQGLYAVIEAAEGNSTAVTDETRPAVVAFRKQLKDAKDVFELLTKQRQ